LWIIHKGKVGRRSGENGRDKKKRLKDPAHSGWGARPVGLTIVYQRTTWTTRGRGRESSGGEGGPLGESAGAEKKTHLARVGRAGKRLVLKGGGLTSTQRGKQTQQNAG